MSRTRSPRATCQWKSAASAVIAAERAVSSPLPVILCNVVCVSRSFCASQKTRLRDSTPSATVCENMAGKDPSGVARVSVRSIADCTSLSACDGTLLASKYCLHQSTRVLLI